jgi:HEAT repeat protein
MMPERQLDFFAGSGIDRDGLSTAAPPAPTPFVAADLDDQTLVAMIPMARLKEAPALAAEAGRRRLPEVVPALQALCRRFSGFGRERTVLEQWVALEALAAIGGTAAAHATTAMIMERVVEGPNRAHAIEVAAKLGARLPATTVLELMADPNADLRAAACACAGQQLALVPRLLELGHDEAGEVRNAAACALGRMGRREALPILTRLLREDPSAAVIDAVAAIADEDCVILLGRIARSRPDLAELVLDSLAVIAHPRARQLLQSLSAGQID